jgi:hypothetical protein
MQRKENEQQQEKVFLKLIKIFLTKFSFQKHHQHDHDRQVLIQKMRILLMKTKEFVMIIHIQHR